MIYHAKNRQGSYGEAIGILLLDCFTPFIPGDVANATTYDYPVRYEVVPNLTVSKMLSHDRSEYEGILTAAKKLRSQGVRAITSDCGFMAMYQKDLLKELDIPVFLSSLLQIPFILSIIEKSRHIGLLTCSGKSINEKLLNTIDIKERERLTVEGLEKHKNWKSQVIDEVGYLDSEEIKKEVVQSALDVTKRDPNVGAILLECSLLPPYAIAVQEATGLPVFDFTTMINMVHQAVIANTYRGHM